VREAPVLGPWQKIIVAWLLADRDVSARYWFLPENLL
jgi:hypothetical protein